MPFSPVFVAYDQRATELAHQVVAHLEAHAIPCWIAPRNLTRQLSAAEQIDTAIAATRVHVFCCLSDEGEARLEQQLLKARGKVIYVLGKHHYFADFRGHEGCHSIGGTNLSSETASDLLHHVREALANGVFISYRRGPTSPIAHDLYRWIKHYLDVEPYLDVDSVPLTVDFEKHIRDYITRTRLFFAIIGGDWLRRDPNGDDFVMMEVDAALAAGCAILPVLVDGAPMPCSHELPERIAALSRRNADEFLSTGDYASQMKGLVREVQKHVPWARVRDAETRGPPPTPSV